MITPQSPKKVKLPTRSRLSIHQQQSQNSLPYYNQHPYYYYSPRLLFSLGIVQLLSGVALVFLSLVAFRIDRERALSWSISIHYLEGVLPEVLRIIWLGAWISTSALLTLLATFKPTSALLQIVLFLTALVTIAITGAFVILISNHVLQNSLLSSLFSTSSTSRELLLSSSIDRDGENILGDDQAYNNLSSDSTPVPDGVAVPSYSRTNGSNMSTSPAAYFHIFIICLCLFCTLSFVISIISCSIVSHHLCSCRRPFYCGAGSKYLAPYQIYNPNGSSANTWSKKQRIVQWVMQQSHQLNSTSVVDHQPSSDVPVVVHHQAHHHPNQHQQHINHQNYHHRSQQHLVLEGPSGGSSSSARKKLSALQSMTSSSTKLSLYES